MSHEPEEISTVSLSGHLRLPNGEPAASAEIYLLQRMGLHAYRVKSTTTQADGGFQFDNLWQGEHEIFVGVPSFPPQRTRIRLREGGLKDFVYPVKRGTQVRGRLMFGDGVPYPKRPLLALGLDGLAKGEIQMLRIQGVWQPQFPIFNFTPPHLIFNHHVATFHDGKSILGIDVVGGTSDCLADHINPVMPSSENTFTNRQFRPVGRLDQPVPARITIFR